MTDTVSGSHRGDGGAGPSEPPARDHSHHRLRNSYFVGTAITAYLIALFALLAGVLLDRHQIPFASWSLLAYLLGGCAAVAVGRAGSALYRSSRRRLAGG